MTTLPIPPGWTAETYPGLEISGKPAPEYTRAIDPDGCKWYDIDGEWTLSVPYFRRSPNLPRDRSDDIALVDTTEGETPYPITEKGTILIGKRRIPPTRWNH